MRLASLLGRPLADALEVGEAFVERSLVERQHDGVVGLDAGRAEQPREPRIAARPREVEAGGLDAQEAVVDDQLLAHPIAVGDTRARRRSPFPRRTRCSPLDE